eukprot:scaffold24456_cov51-Attheya_sp.AAC.1
MLSSTETDYTNPPIPAACLTVMIPTAECSHCGSDPCLWVMYSQQIKEKCDMQPDTLALNDNTQFRYHAYRTFEQSHHGIVCRVKIPECVIFGIRIRAGYNPEMKCPARFSALQVEVSALESTSVPQYNRATT